MWDLDVERQGEGPGVQPGQGGQARPRVVGQVQLPQLRGGRQLVQLLQLVVGQVQLAQPRQLVREAEAPQLVVREAEVSEVAGEEAGLQPLDAVVGEVEAGEAPELVLVPPPGLATQPVLQSAGPHCNQAVLSAVGGLLTCYIICPQKVYVKTSCGIPSHCTVCTVLSAPACDRLEAGEAGEVCEVEAGQGGAGRDLQPGHAAGPRHGPGSAACRHYFRHSRWADLSCAVVLRPEQRSRAPSQPQPGRPHAPPASPASPSSEDWVRLRQTRYIRATCWTNRFSIICVV